MAEWLNNIILLVSVGYTRRGFPRRRRWCSPIDLSTGIHEHAYANIRAIKSLKHMIDMKHMIHAMC